MLNSAYLHIFCLVNYIDLSTVLVIDLVTLVTYLQHEILGTALDTQLYVTGMLVDVCLATTESLTNGGLNSRCIQLCHIQRNLCLEKCPKDQDTVILFHVLVFCPHVFLLHNHKMTASTARNPIQIRVQGRQKDQLHLVLFIRKLPRISPFYFITQNWIT